MVGFGFGRGNVSDRFEHAPVVVVIHRALDRRVQRFGSQTPARRKRWFIDESLHEDSITWVLFGNWGLNTETTLDALLGAAPDRFSYTQEREVEQA